MDAARLVAAEHRPDERDLGGLDHPALRRHRLERPPRRVLAPPGLLGDAEIASSAILVLTHPGQTQLMVTGVRAISSAMARVMPTMACFDAQYAVE